LGHNLPDRHGNRYCINLVCIAGFPAKATWQQSWRLRPTFVIAYGAALLWFSTLCPIVSFVNSVSLLFFFFKVDVTISIYPLLLSKILIYIVNS
jgi:hypothetical protein